MLQSPIQLDNYLREVYLRMGDWDKSLKTLVAKCPQAFAELIVQQSPYRKVIKDAALQKDQAQRD
jgi:hypothetical protein